MESVSNISSEEELLQLRNEGKISEDEYEQLQAAMQKTSQVDVKSSTLKTDKTIFKHKLGITAFVLMLAGIILPVVIYIICWIMIAIDTLTYIDKDTVILLSLLAFIPTELAALGTGIASWSNPFGKATTISSSLLLTVVFLVTLGTMPVVKTVPQRDIDNTEMIHTSSAITELKRFALDSMDGVITRSGIQIDKQISSDGNGSLRIEASEPTTVRLFDTGDIDIENSKLIYQAKLRMEEVDHSAYLEMWCHFPGKGDFFSRDPTPVSGTTEWTTEETLFFLKHGENPDNVKLNIVINGHGTVWIDDIRLLKAPL
jgi:hypothetical protein